MVDAEVVERRLLALNEAIDRINEHPEAQDVERLRTDALLRAAIERWLHMAIEACIDLAHHVVAERGWTPPETARQAFYTLASHGIISPDLAGRLGVAVGLRNVIVHEYAEVDLEIVARVAAKDIADLRQLGSQVGALLKPGA